MFHVVFAVEDVDLAPSLRADVSEEGMLVGVKRLVGLSIDILFHD